MSKFTKAALLLGIARFTSLCFGGTVITNNLPANTAIVNINATQDGAASYNGDQSLWYHPFSTRGANQLLAYAVAPGTYSFRVINPADSARIFPTLTSSQTNQIFTAWTYNSPWILDYLVFDGAAETNFSLPQIFDGSPEWPPYDNADAAYSASLTNGFYNLIRTGPLGRDSSQVANSYTFNSAAKLIFVVPDYGLGDNSGGVSVLISPSVPLLTIASNTGTVTLQWPTNAVGLTLSQTTNLVPAVWSDVTNLQAVTIYNYSVTLPISQAPHTFFRLRNP